MPAPFVFICYRRDDSAFEADVIFRHLVSDFGKHNVFMDIDGIAPGQDFRKVVKKKIENCDVVVALIGRNWLSPESTNGLNRLNEPEDFVRVELETATVQEVPIVPVLLRGAVMPLRVHLPPLLQNLPFLHASQVRHGRDRDRDLEDLSKALKACGGGAVLRRNRSVNAKPDKSETTYEKNSSGKLKIKWTSTALAIILATIAAAFVWRAVEMKVEAAKAEAAKVDLETVEAAIAMAARAEAARAEAARAEAARAEAAKAEVARAEVARAEAAKAEVAKAEVAKAEVAKAEAAKAEAAKAEAAKALLAEIRARDAKAAATDAAKAAQDGHASATQPRSTDAVPPTVQGAITPSVEYYLQTGEFQTKQEADRHANWVSTTGFAPVVTFRDTGGGLVYRVRVGPYLTKEQAEDVEVRITKRGGEVVMVRVWK